MSEKLIVGDLMPGGQTQYDEIPEYNSRSGAHRLIIPMAQATAEEIEAVKTGDVKLAFTTIGDVIMFQARFGAIIPWCDAAYTWHKLPAEEQIRPPELTGNQRMMLTIILLEATTGEILAIRAVSMSPTMSKRLNAAINRQADAPFPADYDEQAWGIFNRYSSQQLRDKALASCTGGDSTDRPSPY